MSEGNDTAENGKDNNQREQTLFQMFVSEKDQPEKEDRCFRKSVNFGKIKRDIYGRCWKCGLVNNITKNKSTFCGECGTMLTDRRFEKMEDNSTSLTTA